MSKQRIVIRKEGSETTTNIEPRSNPNPTPKPQLKPEVVREESYRSKRTTGTPYWKFVLFTIIGFVLGIVVFLGIQFLLMDEELGDEVSTELIESNSNDDEILKKVKGFDFNKNILSEPSSLRGLLEQNFVAKSDAKKMGQKAIAKGIDRLRAGDKYAVYYKEEDAPKFFVIEPKKDPYNKYLIEMEAFQITKLKKTREIRESSMAAIVESNLGITFINNNLDLKLIKQIENIFAWSIDLFSLKDGDRFKILYNEEFLDGKPYRLIDISAAFFNKEGEDYFAFKFKEGGKSQYYTENGETLKKSFLKTPIKYGGVITSGFGLRIHPVKNTSKMHYGTDFAAPEGTPIQAVADGVISHARFTAFNGNYVKIRHDKVFETQYLHMTKWAEGMKPGVKVRQGQVIGYVGSTGMSTGPHVCFRFWKNNQQVDPKKERIGVSSQINPGKYSEYMKFIEPLKKRLSKIEYL